MYSMFYFYLSINFQQNHHSQTSVEIKFGSILTNFMKTHKIPNANSWRLLDSKFMFLNYQPSAYDQKPYFSTNPYPLHFLTNPYPLRIDNSQFNFHHVHFWGKSCWPKEEIIMTTEELRQYLVTIKIFSVWFLKN